MVTNASGTPQMGATVFLYNRYDRLLAREITTDQGLFAFTMLLPDVYAVRVSLASFLPAMKRNIVVQPGMQSLLNVNLATVFSSIQLVSVVPGDTSFMSDEWKWVLRSAGATRPVLRLAPDIGIARETSRKGTAIFSSTSGMVKVSGGDQGSLLSSDPDLGTAFALATCFLGTNQVKVAGNFGYSATGAPTTALHTSFRRQVAGTEAPELNLTMRQVYLPARAGSALMGGMQEGAPVLRTLSAAVADHMQLTEQVRLDYGAALDSVSFFDRLNYLSPYGRITYDVGTGEVFQFSYATGTPPAQLAGRNAEGGIQQDLSTLGAFPRVSVRDGRVRIQRSRSWEASYRRTIGSRTVSVGFYDETMSNAAVMLSGAGQFEGLPDLLPDVYSESAIFNAGGFQSLGFIASVSQKLGDHFEASGAYSSGSALTAGGMPIDSANPDDLRALIHNGRRHAVTTRLSGLIPRTGTQFVSSYQWADLAALTPSHVYLTQPVQEAVGFNIQVRQPIPYFGGLPGHLEITADLRNLLADGYVPVNAAGRRMYLVQSPRMLRGGLSFVF